MFLFVAVAILFLAIQSSIPVLSSSTRATITCVFTADNTIEAVYLNNVNVTSQITDYLDNPATSDLLQDWSRVKVHKFLEPTETFTTGLSYAFMISEELSSASPTGSGFVMACTSSLNRGSWHNLVTEVSSKWQAFASTTSDELLSVTMLTSSIGNGFPKDWYSSGVTGTAVVGESTSAFQCYAKECSQTGTKIWVTDDGFVQPYRYAGFKIFVTPYATKAPTLFPTNSPLQPTTPTLPTLSPSQAPTFAPSIPINFISCYFTADNIVLSVYLNNVDITSNITDVNGNPASLLSLQNWNDVKYLTFVEPEETYTTGVAFAFKIQESSGAASPYSSGFILGCTSSLKKGPWHHLVTEVSSKWQAFASTSENDASSIIMLTPTISNAFPMNWYTENINGTAIIGKSTSGFECNYVFCNSASSGAKKIWVTDDESFTYFYAGFKTLVYSPPTMAPTSSPSKLPTSAPSYSPSVAPTFSPTPPTPPTLSPTEAPTFSPIIPINYITCAFTADNGISNVYLNDIDVTSEITDDFGNQGVAANLGDWTVTKYHRFVEPIETHTTGVTYAFKVYEDDETASPFVSGFVMGCRSSLKKGPWHHLVTEVSSKWQAFAATSENDSRSVNMLTPTIGDSFPINWYSSGVNGTAIIGRSASPFSCNDRLCYSEESKVWVTDDGVAKSYRYAAFKVFVLASPTSAPSYAPTFSPSKSPLKTPTNTPTNAPTFPTSKPTTKPTNDPTGNPTGKPSNVPTATPIQSTTKSPSVTPTKVPTNKPVGSTPAPTKSPVVTVPCSTTNKKLCTKDSRCLWIKVDKKKQCALFTCSALTKKTCKKDSRCAWNGGACTSPT